jgi:ribosomal protein S18 acetylase RimI-like enzyme
VQVTVNIRPLEFQDLDTAKTIIDQTGLFPAAFLDAMVEGYFSSSSTGDRWFTYDAGRPVALVYCAPERLTEGTWNMLLLAVQPGFQGRGIGAALVKHLEQQLALDGARVIIVETSGLPEFQRTRTFYSRCGYTLEARIRDFYRAGDDKLVFWKSL